MLASATFDGRRSLLSFVPFFCLSVCLVAGYGVSRKVPQLMIYMRVANMVLCVLLAATAISKLLVAGDDVSGAVLACYLL